MAVNHRTNKTTHVLSLLGGSGYENPLLGENSSGERKIDKKNKKPQNKKNFIYEDMEVHEIIEKTLVNVISLIVYEMLPEILQRFNACDCKMCQAEIAIEALSEIPPLFIKNTGSKKCENEIAIKKEENEDIVRKALIKIVIKNKREKVNKNHNADGANTRLKHPNKL